MEFALVSPLIFVCMYLIVATTATCLQLLSMNDVARNGARIAATSQDPAEVAVSFAHQLGYSASISTSTDGQFITVTVHRDFKPFTLSQWLSPVPLRATSTMMHEPPMVLE